MVPAMMHPKHLKAGTPTPTMQMVPTVAMHTAAFSLRTPTHQPQQTTASLRAAPNGPLTSTLKLLSPFHGNLSTHTHCKRRPSKQRLPMEVKLRQDHSRVTSRTTSSKRELGPPPRKKSCWRLSEVFQARTGMLSRRWFPEEMRSSVCKSGKPTWTLRSTDCPGPRPRTRSLSRPTTDTETHGSRLPRWSKPALGTSAITVSVPRASRLKFSRPQGLIRRVLRMEVFLVVHAQKDLSLARNGMAKRGKDMDHRVV